MGKKYRPVMLAILDGWGVAADSEGNAIALARTPFYEQLMKKYPHCLLRSSGEAVGLPDGQMGNSEVGHLNIGAGRVVYQEFTRITKAIKEGEIAQNPVIIRAMEEAALDGKALHFMGLLSDGGVHSHIGHLFALMDLAQAFGVKKLFVHPILDGRDVPPKSAGQYLKALEKKMQELGLGQIASLAGRYYTMDRDKRWERIGAGYRAMVVGEGSQAYSAGEVLAKSYEMGITDEFVMPTVIVDGQGEPVGQICRGDVVIMFNFRADRARQISYTFTEEVFTGFMRPGGYPKVHYVCLTQYDVSIKAPVVFSPQNLENTLGEVVSKAGLKQLRIAETEKYAHVTFFFNGGMEKANPGEDRILVSSPTVATYDLQPEMSAMEVTKQAVEKVGENKYDLIVLNYANPDMVGHTGQLPACIKAIETVDGCLDRVVEAVLEQDGCVLITADHGNAEQMINGETREPFTAHTTNIVPCVLVGKGLEQVQLCDGALEDLAPTILELMGLAKPGEMTGRSLLR